MTDQTKMDKNTTEKNGQGSYSVDYDNLALPEVHTGKAEPQHPEQASSGINEFQAIPEIHIRRKKS